MWLLLGVLIVDTRASRLVLFLHETLLYVFSRG